MEMPTHSHVDMARISKADLAITQVDNTRVMALTLVDNTLVDSKENLLKLIAHVCVMTAMCPYPYLCRARKDNVLHANG